MAARFGDTIQRDDWRGCRVALIGAPDDTGVRLNGGRTGAAQGPSAFREALARYATADPAGWQWPGVYDAGDVPVASSLRDTHDALTDEARRWHDRGLLPVMIGGGHDLTFPFVRAAVDAHGVGAGIYLDAHLDVRQEEGSGMPFRRLIEECGIHELRVFGLDRMANHEEHVRYFHEHGGRIVDDTEPQPEGWPDGPLFVSIDLDVIDQGHAPGVSAMNPVGWRPEAVAAWAFHAGRDTRVTCFDLMELSPPHDEGGRTARLAARLFLEFLRGLALRADGPAT